MCCNLGDDVCHRGWLELPVTVYLYLDFRQKPNPVIRYGVVANMMPSHKPERLGIAPSSILGFGTSPFAFLFLTSSLWTWQSVLEILMTFVVLHTTYTYPILFNSIHRQGVSAHFFLFCSSYKQQQSPRPVSVLRRAVRVRE
ncbi:hypothetical protein LX36DRAFT_486760 [Colletotrichum falcatum]|nr:hypothetical protein LX36DRAFT_486760 [Colletotrichum falcatum]